MPATPDKSALLSALIDGTADAACLDQIARLADEDPLFASAVAEELRWSEWIRQGLGGLALDARRTAERFDAALDAETFSPDALSSLVVEGEAPAACSDRLARALLDEPERVLALRRALAFDEVLRTEVTPHKSEEAFLESLETRMWAESTRDHFVEALEERLGAEASPEEFDPKVAKFAVPWTQLALRMGSVAAAVALGAFALAHQLTVSIHSSDDDGTYATAVKTTRDVLWSGQTRPDEAGRLGRGRYHLESGVVALRFPSGAEMTVEGPAVFDVTGPDAAYVYHGLALARAPSTESGIAIRSRGMDLEQPVPLIGIDARSEYSTGVVVFDGDGGICLPNGGCRIVNPRESVRADFTRDRLVDVPYNPQPFARGWELLAGVESKLGPVRIELPGTSADAPANATTPPNGEGEVRVFVERDTVAPDQPFEVENIRPGHFAAVGSNPGQSLQTRGELRSYLLQLWPAEGEMEASLTFDHEVVGVIFTSDRLAESSTLLGTPNASAVPGGRVGDAPPSRHAEGGGSEILLSDDRRTLNLRVRPGDAPLDQVRVLVALH